MVHEDSSMHGQDKQQNGDFWDHHLRHDYSPTLHATIEQLFEPLAYQKS